MSDNQRGLTFAELHNTNRLRCEEVFHPIDGWSPTDWACALAGEVGELCNLIKKLRRGENIPLHELADEAADVQIYLDLLCTRLGIDLSAATVRKFNRISQERGSTHYLPEHVRVGSEMCSRRHPFTVWRDSACGECGHTLDSDCHLKRPSNTQATTTHNAEAVG